MKNIKDPHHISIDTLIAQLCECSECRVDVAIYVASYLPYQKRTRKFVAGNHNNEHIINKFKALNTT